MLRPATSFAIPQPLLVAAIWDSSPGRKRNPSARVLLASPLSLFSFHAPSPLIKAGDALICFANSRSHSHCARFRSMWIDQPQRLRFLSAHSRFRDPFKDNFSNGRRHWHSHQSVVIPMVRMSRLWARKTRCRFLLRLLGSIRPTVLAQNLYIIIITSANMFQSISHDLDWIPECERSLTQSSVTVCWTVLNGIKCQRKHGRTALKAEKCTLHLLFWPYHQLIQTKIETLSRTVRWAAFRLMPMAYASQPSYFWSAVVGWLLPLNHDWRMHQEMEFEIHARTIISLAFSDLIPRLQKGFWKEFPATFRAEPAAKPQRLYIMMTMQPSSENWCLDEFQKSTRNSDRGRDGSHSSEIFWKDNCMIENHVVKHRSPLANGERRSQ